MQIPMLKYGVFLSLIAFSSCAQPDPRQNLHQRLQSATWPIFRGDAGLSGIAKDKVPEALALLWTFETGGEIVSTPAVGFGRVYVSSTDGSVCALDIAEGSLRWRFEAKDAFEASPMLLDTALYVGSLNGDFYALNAVTGQVQWQVALGAGIYGSANWADVPGHSGKHILVGCYDNRLYCFNAESGALKWTYETRSYINGTPATDGRRVVFGGCDERLHIVDISDGSKAGEVDVGSYIPGSAALVNGHAYVGHYNDAMVCISLADQKVVWEYRDESRGGPFFSSPAVGKDRVVVGSRDESLHCIDRKTGQKLWTFRTRDEIDSSPVIAGDHVIVGSDDGRLYRIDLASGRELWTYEIGAAISGSPAVAGGRVFIGAEDGNVYAFGALP